MLYRPLNASDIRLITIIPSDDPDGPVVCQLTHHDITERAYTEAYTAALKGDAAQHDWNRRPAQQWAEKQANATPVPATYNLPPFRYVWGDFVALSYTWGDPARTRSIRMNDLTIDVTLNLYEALLALRSRPFIQSGWKIWIDALCINQGDVWERGTEVKRMGDIYATAWTPIIWLGTAADASEQAYQLIRRLAPHCDEPDQVIKLNRILKNKPDEFGDGSWRALHDLLARKYWRRAWIVQEGSLGKADTPVLCGDQELPFITVYRMFMFLGRTDEVLNIYMRGELETAGRTINNDIHISIGVVAKIGEYQQETESGNTHLDTFSAIQISRSVDATNPRDKIYGLLALMPNDLTQHIHPDYTAPVADVYASFARLTIEQTKSLEILRMVAPPKPTSTLSLPSWIPDFTTPHELCSLGSVPHRASGTTTPTVSFPSSSSSITTRGLLIDTIDGLGCEWSNGWPASTCLPSPPSAQRNPYGTFSGAKDALWRTLVSNRSVYTTALEEDYSLLLSVPAIDKAAKSGTHLSPDLLDLAKSHLLSYCVRAFEGNKEFTLAGHKLGDFFDVEPDFERIGSKEVLPSLRHALNARDRINLYRRLFTTAECGFVGVGMQEVKKGDVVAVLYGFSMPVVLRGDGEGKGRWRVVGECYVHGLMEGEGLGMLERGEAGERDFEIW
ncbi:HET-domain-containing protein [Podospora aff. communis PSN243]|uniref:HET-domain-containing protein n=1 Tax=Podospora aff. communis PSN243 TaxID=3040156 RepID=A0AAV9GAV3_9PEZI|nr:HET-domain-containing protein [Podospora aff. communis PSN243]